MSSRAFWSGAGDRRMRPFGTWFRSWMRKSAEDIERAQIRRTVMAVPFLGAKKATVVNKSPSQQRRITKTGVGRADWCCSMSF